MSTAPVYIGRPSSGTGQEISGVYACPKLPLMCYVLINPQTHSVEVYISIPLCACQQYSTFNNIIIVVRLCMQSIL